MGSHWFHQKNAGKAHTSPEMQPYGYDPMRFHPEVQSYGGVSTVAPRNSDSDHHQVDLTLRLGLPQYDLPDQHKTSTIPKTTPHCPQQHYSNFNSPDSYCQWLRQARTQYTAGNKSYGGWGYTAKQTGRTQDTGSSNDTGRLLGSRATIPGFGGSSNYYRTYDSAPASMVPAASASNLVPWRRAHREMEAERCSSLEAAYNKQMGRAQCDGLMGFPEAEKRCTKCNSDDTPMWRKGPLGPKSLCNACGIKYRKDLERRKAAVLALGTGRIGGGRGHYN